MLYETEHDAIHMQEFHKLSSIQTTKMKVTTLARVSPRIDCFALVNWFKFDEFLFISPFMRVEFVINYKAVIITTECMKF